MKPLTYLGFTIFSVFVQFCVMEFIYEKLEHDKGSISLNETAQKNNDIIKQINRKPHALFYRTPVEQRANEGRNYARSSKYSNSTLEDVNFSTTTDMSVSTFDVFYDENTSVTDAYFTTESFFTDSELDNVTEITLMDKTSSTTSRPSQKKKKTKKENCFCDLLYKKCDVDCCCDDDCSEEERSIFIECIENDRHKQEWQLQNNFPACRNAISTSKELNDLFCVVTVNLPKKRVKSHFKLDEASINATFKWNNIDKSDKRLDYKKKKYEYGDPLWFIKNESIFSMCKCKCNSAVVELFTQVQLDLPTSVTNNYCSGRKHIKFLLNDNVQCNVKLEDLYALPALEILEGSKLISVTDLSLNNTGLNCSSLHCANWTVVACDYISCRDFNRSIHMPRCEGRYCNNLPLKLEYTFYYSQSSIINATLKLHMKNVSTSIPLMVQEIDVKWYVGNESIEDIVHLSGSPGYIPGLPIIVSSAAQNHTFNFFNRTFGTILSFPHNDNGECIWPVDSKNIEFGFNKRSKCRLRLQQNIVSSNATKACQRVQMTIRESLRLHQKLFVSPFGNPTDVSDDSWVPIQVDDRSFVYGVYHTDGSKLNCYNIIARYAIVVAYADVSEAINRQENKIVKATADATKSNVTFDVTNLSIVLTLDASFIDISRPLSEFAKAPSLDVHLPANFFFDSPSNKCYILSVDTVSVYFTSLVLLIISK